MAFIVQLGFAQNFNKAKLDSYFDALQNHDKFMGSVAVSQNGQLIYRKTIGYSDVPNKIRANERTKYRIGSSSKTFTAVLVFKAVEEGKLNLDQVIDRYFPAIKNADKITIAQLLSHRSGIHDFTSNVDYFDWNTSPKTEKELLEVISKGGSDFSPGSRAFYSSSNYVLLTNILEKAFGKPYSDILRDYITQPLNLSNTYVGGKINVGKNESKSYRWDGKWVEQPETDLSVLQGSGNIVSNSEDLAKFTDALFGAKIITNESLLKMQTFMDNFGMGLFQYPFDNKIGLGHNGGVDGFTSIFIYYKDGGVTYAMTSNGSNYNNNNLAVDVLSAIYNQPYDIPDFKKMELLSAELDKYLGEYSSSAVPLKITISKNGSTLIAQATGQPSFPLDATDKDKFKFDAAGVVMEFDPANNSFVLLQGGGSFKFTKE